MEKFVYQKEIRFIVDEFEVEGYPEKIQHIRLYKVRVNAASDFTPSFATIRADNINGPEGSTADNGLYLYKIDFDQTEVIDYAVKVLCDSLKENKLPEGFIQKLM